MNPLQTRNGWNGLRLKHSRHRPWRFTQAMRPNQENHFRSPPLLLLLPGKANECLSLFPFRPFPSDLYGYPFTLFWLQKQRGHLSFQLRARHVYEIRKWCVTSLFSFLLSFLPTLPRTEVRWVMFKGLLPQSFILWSFSQSLSRPQNPPDPTQSLRAEGSTQHNYKSPLTKTSIPLPQGGYCYIKISIGSVVQGEPM